MSSFSLDITAFYAGLLTLLLLALTARVIVYRRTNKLSLGDTGDSILLQRMRAQANLTEYAPLGLILMALAELQGAPAAALHLMGAVLLAGRLMHAIGFSRRPQIMPLRVGGMVLTLSMLLVSALALIAHSIAQ
ncbi:MAPEG family protein [uncultured Sulfitobacter sp.]|uniref:MAPEG family protein n=1 Tax=uncultured Sulfitobacter sp. TaxID=191468 RepID=UPI00260DFE0D|nr:MAPEG family protein [uncultured Sulfitobacter sp.]